MSNQFSRKLFDINKSITQGPGASETALRSDIVSYAGAAALRQDTDRGLISKELLPYLNKVIHHAYKVTDADVQQLKRRAYFEDELYEITISAAFGAGYARYQKGMSLLNQN
jgi:hypothetical protein